MTCIFEIESNPNIMNVKEPREKFEAFNRNYGKKES